MATATEPEDSPSAPGGAKGEANRKRGNEHGEGGAGGGGGGQKRKKKEVFIYGNYKNYYGYRVSAKAASVFAFNTPHPHPSVHGRCCLRVVASCSTDRRLRCSWGLGIRVF